MHPLPRRPRPLGAMLALSVLLALLGGAFDAARADGGGGTDGTDGKLLLLMDSSGSMKEPDPSGGTKIEAAGAALDQVVDGLPDGAQTGLRVYGQSPLSKGQPGACTDTKLVVPVGTDNADRLHAAIASYAPAGETPIAYSLQQAAKDVGSEGQRTIVLVSDGEETCNPDPCAVARSIAGQGIDLRIDVVGFRVNAAAKQQLQCIAQAGHGQYYDAQNGDDLLGSLDRLSTRAFKPFEITGKKVQGRPDAVGAPVVGIGQYATEVGGEGDERWYLLKKTPGTSFRVSFSLRPDDDDQSDSLRARAYTTDGAQCGDPGTAGDIGNMNNRHELVSGSLVADARADQSDSVEPCVAASKVRIQLERTRGGSDTVPVELVLTEEPPVKDVSGLPGAIEKFTPDDLKTGFRTDVTPTKVVGGSGFSDATTITDGVYSDGILAGEALLYRVKLDFGQHLETRVRLPAPGPALAQAAAGTSPGIEMDVEDYAPDRSQLPLGFGTAGYFGHAASTFGVSTPEVRYLNRAGQYDVVGASTAGYYYVVVTLAKNDQLAGAIVPFDLDVRVVGEKSGEPTYEKLTKPTSSDQGSAAKGDASTSADDDTSGAGLNLSAGAVGGVLVVVLVAGLGLLLLARRRA